MAAVVAAAPAALAQPRYALASWSAGEASGEPFPLVAAGLTMGLAWLPVVGPTIGYAYAGDPIRGAWVGAGQLTAGGAGWFAGYCLGALASPWLPARVGGPQAAADLGAGYGMLGALVAYTLWTGQDAWRVAEATRRERSTHPVF